MNGAMCVQHKKTKWSKQRTAWQSRQIYVRWFLFFPHKSELVCCVCTVIWRPNITRERRVEAMARSAKCFIICNHVTWYRRFGPIDAAAPAVDQAAAVMKIKIYKNFSSTLSHVAVQFPPCNFPLVVRCIFIIFLPTLFHTNVVYTGAALYARVSSVLCFIYIRINPSCCLLNGSTNYGAGERGERVSVFASSLGSLRNCVYFSFRFYRRRISSSLILCPLSAARSIHTIQTLVRSLFNSSWFCFAFF